MYPYEETVKPGKIEYLVNFGFVAIWSAVLVFMFDEWAILMVVVAVWIVMLFLNLKHSTQVEIVGSELIITGKKFEEKVLVSDILEVSKCFFFKSKHRIMVVPMKRQDGSEIKKMKSKHGYFGVFGGIILRLKNGEQVAVPTHRASELMEALGFIQNEY